MSLLAELKRRNVLRVGAAYVVASWLLIQVAETIFPLFGFDDTPARLVVIILAIGLIPALIFAWAFELTPEGFKKEKDVDRSKPINPAGAKKLDRLIMVVLALALGYFVFDKFVLDPARDEAIKQAALEEAGAGEIPAARLGKAILVTDFPGAHTEPNLSPDGKRIAFVSPDENGVAQVWVMSLPDGDPVQITHGDLAATGPSWSPTQDQILFVRATDGAAASLWLVDALGTQAPRMVLSNGNDPQFAPDGRSFVFVRGRKGIWIGSLDGSPPVPLESLPNNGFALPMPTINAKGDIVFVMADEGPVGDLWIYEAAANEFRRLTRPVDKWPGVGASWPVWMPDERTVVYSAPFEDVTNLQLWSIDTVTGRFQQISSGPGGYAHPTVSRDGSRLAYAHQRPVSRLIETHPGTGEERTILETRDPIVLPKVSPDGENVVYFGEYVYTVPVTGGRPQQRTFGPSGEATLPDWSRSDQSIWYYKGRTLQRLEPDTGLSELVMDDFHWSRQNWFAVHGGRLAYNLRGPDPSVVQDLSTGVKVNLGQSIFPMQWSRDGEQLLAWRAEGQAIVICEAPEMTCNPVESGSTHLSGQYPQWSEDESRIFALRPSTEAADRGEIWSAPAEGGEARFEASIGPYEPANKSIGIAKGDRIIWNAFDAAGGSEIWMSDELQGLSSN